MRSSFVTAITVDPFAPTAHFSSPGVAVICCAANPDVAVARMIKKRTPKRRKFASLSSRARFSD